MRAVALCFVVSVAFLVFLFHAAVNDAKDRPALQLQVRPQIAIGPTDLDIQVRLQPNNSDRVLRVETHGALFERVSEVPLEGERSPTLYRFSWLKVYPGDEYDIIASVANGMQQIRASERQRVIVVSP